MIAGLGVDKLDIDAHAIAAALHRAFEYVAHPKFPADLLHVGMFAFVSESRVAGDHERARDTREVGGQALGHAVNEILLLRVAT